MSGKIECMTVETNYTTGAIERMTVEIKGLGKITASPDVLNYIGLLAGQSMELNKQKGFFSSADYARFVLYTLHDALGAVGFYKNCKAGKECAHD